MVDAQSEPCLLTGRTSQDVPRDDSALLGVEPEARNRELPAEFVRVNDAPCALCGYNLRGLTGDVCPECGQVFALRVSAPNLRYHLFVACLAPMLLHIGLTVFLLAMTLRHGLPPVGVVVFHPRPGGSGECAAAVGAVREAQFVSEDVRVRTATVGIYKLASQRRNLHDGHAGHQLIRERIP